ncbi:hypothetical protein RND81_13G046300 [Saponaria officinalis]|uniref:Cytochrome P450 n=1 Tax=Saponaria officinalis TaxID=3572 RepID=A0AAW1H2I7_SAPOF
MLYISAEFAVKFLAALISLFLTFYVFSTKRRSKEKSLSLPGPSGLPVVGYLPFLGSDLRFTFKDLADIYGPIFKVRLGYKEAVVITSPSLAKEVLRDKDVVFSNRDPTVAAKIAVGGSDIAFSDNGPEWRKMKKIFVSEMLSNANLDATSHHRKHNVKIMINKTYKKAGELVDIGELVFITIIGSVMSMVWGNSMKGLGGNAIDAEFRSVVADFMFLLGEPNISDFLPCFARFDLQGVRRRMTLAAERIEKLFDLAIQHHSAADTNNQKDFLGCLLQHTKLEDPATSLTLPQVKGILTDAIIGGMDTTSSTVELAMAQILKHPEIMRKIQEELTEIVGLNNTIDESHLSKLKYLNAVLKETLRLHPAVPLFVPHRPKTSTTVGGYTVPKDSQIFINVWAIHRDPQLWENPTEFRPKRFLNGSEKSDFMGKQFEYLPFGSGRRMCPGKQFEYLPFGSGRRMVPRMLVLGSLLHCFEWKLPNDTVDVDLTEKFGIVVRKSTPLLAVPSPRLSKVDLYSMDSISE